MIPQAGAAPELEALLLDLERRIDLQKPIALPQQWTPLTRARCEGLDAAISVVRQCRMKALAPRLGSAPGPVNDLTRSPSPPDQKQLRTVQALCGLLHEVLERTQDQWAAGDDEDDTVSSGLDRATHLAKVLTREADGLDAMEVAR